MTLLVQALWLAMPTIIAGVLHMVVVKRGWLSALAVPLDGGRVWRGHRLFGDNKTWRGVVVMLVIGGVVGALQGALFGALASDRGWSSLGDTMLHAGTAAQYALANLVFALGYVVGELPNSFLKRRLQIAPGAKGAGPVGLLFLLVDQADSVVAGFVFGALLFPFSLSFVVGASVILSGVHLLITVVLAALRIKRTV